MENFMLKQTAVCLLLLAGVLGAGCSSAPKKAATYAQVIQANQDCQTDADCVAVNRSCCRCDGKIAVNRRVAGTLRAKWLSECPTAVCTQEMCYTDLSVSCQANRCVGTAVK